ncbi:MAG: hypothetical protein ACTMIX_10835, partial [Kluyvera intermedia]
REHRFFNNPPATLAGFAITVKNLKPEQRTVVFVIIHLATHRGICTNVARPSEAPPGKRIQR